MEKTTAIIILVVLALILVLLVRLLFPSIKSYMVHMPKGVLWLLTLIIMACIVYLIVYLTADDPSGLPFLGHKEEVTAVSEEEKEAEKMLSEGIIISGNVIYIDDERADMQKVLEYIDLRIREKKDIILVDDYASSRLYHEVEDVCKERNVTPKYVKKEN